jgi:ketosteroid isomerase-like protein
MSKMTVALAEEFGAAWNSGDADLVASYFTDDGVYHASVGPDPLGRSYIGKEEVRRGAGVFFARFPGARFHKLKADVSGDLGTFEWEFTYKDDDGVEKNVVGCDVLRFRGNKVVYKSGYRKQYG